MPAIRALVFDFDGLILDTETACFAAWQALFAEHGQIYALEDYLQIVGTHNGVRDPAGLLRKRTGLDHDSTQIHAWLSAHERRLTKDLVPLPGVVALLDQAYARGLPLAVASSSSHKWVDGHLRNQGLFERFTTTVCRDDVARVKPEPDLYLEAIRRLGVAPAEALAIEDSYNGSLAAVRAGLRCLAVPNDITRSQDFAHVHRRIETLAGFDLSPFLKELGAN